MRIRICYCLLFAAVAAIASCKKAPDEQPAWFRNHTSFYYDVETDSSIEQGARLLTVTVQNAAGDLFFWNRPTDTSLRTWQAIFSIFGNGVLKPRADGLYSHASTTCGVGLISYSFDYLSIPADARVGATIPQYGCEHRDEGANQILNSDTVITVPAGSFHTFCVLHNTGDRSYWNRDAGIVMYEQWNADRASPRVKMCTLKLRRME